MTTSNPSLTQEVIMPGLVGMHARPAAILLKLIKSFPNTELIVTPSQGPKAGQATTIRSLPSLLMMGIGAGHTLSLSASGESADALLKAVCEAFAEGLGENEAPETLEPKADSFNFPKLDDQGHASLSGVSASPGLAMGKVISYHKQALAPSSNIQPEGLEEEKKRFQKAVTKATSDLETEKANHVKGSASRQILGMHLVLLDDESLQEDTLERIEKGQAAALAWHEGYRARAAMLASNPDPLLAQREADIVDVGERVLRVMIDAPAPLDLSTLPKGSVLWANDLSPAEASRLDPALVEAVLLNQGGPTAHSAIILRSLAIPLVVSLGQSMESIQQGQLVVADATVGKVYQDPSEALLKSATEARARLLEAKACHEAAKFEPAKLTSGETIAVRVNISAIDELKPALEAGADGAGLVRSEFLFLSATSLPTEAEQFDAYQMLAGSFEKKPVVIRTLDIGADKPVSYLDIPREENPALGVRGARLSLHFEAELMRPQLRALLRTYMKHPNLSIMFPMINDLTEVRRIRSLVEEEARSLKMDSLPKLGVMVEVPSVALLADAFAKEVDFFSVGTNDLTSYTLAADRVNGMLASSLDSLHPAALRLIQLAFDAASRQQKGFPLGVCGTLAADPLGALVLAGLGAQSLSMESSQIATIKALLRSKSLESLQALAKQACQQTLSTEVRALKY